MKIYIAATHLVMEDGDVELEDELRTLLSHYNIIRLKDLIQAHLKWQKRKYEREH